MPPLKHMPFENAKPLEICLGQRCGQSADIRHVGKTVRSVIPGYIFKYAVPLPWPVSQGNWAPREAKAI
jgi:hypothetical protein